MTKKNINSESNNSNTLIFTTTKLKENKDYHKLVFQGLNKFMSKRTGLEIMWSTWGMVFVGITNKLA